MRLSHCFCAALTLLLLNGCVQRQVVRIKADAVLLAQQEARERQLMHVDHWILQGRIGVSNGKDAGSGNLTWVQRGERYEFILRAPITGKSFRLTGDADGALLEGLEGGPLRGPNAEALMRHALGWYVPLRQLRAWVLGMRAQGEKAELSFGQDNLLSLLQQDGWSVSYPVWNSARQPPLPAKVFAEKPPYSVRLAIQSWVIQ